MNASERDLLLGRLDERTENTLKKLDEHNGDIKALKQWQAKLTGAFCLLAAVVVFFQAEIVRVVTDVFGS